jgi:exosortase/archaeosortase family protein
VAGGCSGIRSLIAMTMLSLLYAHFNERVPWKKAAIFAMTLPFTVLGNIVRVFTIVLVSKWFGQEVGTGPWHDISGFVITIPIAVGAMMGFHELLGIDLSRRVARVAKPPPAAAKADAPAEGKPAPPSSPVSYDY